MSRVSEIQEKFLWCRDVLHSWDPYDAFTQRNKKSRRNEVHQILRCTWCSTYKKRRLTDKGDLIRASYTYPSGYLLTEQGQLTPADRAEIRRINLQKNGSKA